MRRFSGNAIRGQATMVMKNSGLFLAVCLVATSAMSCSSGVEFSGINGEREKVEEVQRASAAGGAGDAMAETGAGGIDPVAPQPKEFSLTVTTSLTNKKKDEPVEILFVLDNSQSMSDNIAKLKDSSQALFSGLNTAGLPYRARIMTMDKIHNLISPVAGTDFVAPRGVFGGTVPNYNRTPSDENSYLGVEPFGGERDLAGIVEAIGKSVSDKILLDNEPGICAAMDYMNWTSNTRNPGAVPFRDGQKVHVITISDEDNGKVVETRDRFTGGLQSSKDLVCYQYNQNTPNCENVTVPKKIKEASWTGYGFRVVIPAQNSYSYQFDYQPQSTCQSRGVVPYPGGSDQLVRLYGIERCHKTRMTCRDKLQFTRNYSCQSGSGAPITGTVNLQQQNAAICQVAETFRCEQLVDGAKVWLDLPRTTAIAEIINKPERGLKCEAVAASERSAQMSTGSEDLLRGIRSCEAFSCAEIESSYKTVTVDKDEVLANEDRYLATSTNGACTAEVDYWHYENSYYKFLPAISSGKLTGLTERNCTATSSSLTETRAIPSAPNGDLLSGTQLCLSQVTQKAAEMGWNLSEMGVAIRDHAADPPRMKIHVNAGPFTSPRTKEQVAQNKGYPAAHVGYFENYVETVTPGVPVEKTLVYSTDVYATLVATYGAANVQRLDAAADPRLGPKMIVEGSAAETSTFPWNGEVALAKPWTAEKGVAVIERDHPTETVQTQVCGQPTISNKTYAPTPANFLELMKILHPTTSMTWHSIVNTSGASCPGSNENTFSKGVDYLALSQATDGLVENICEPNFDRFAKFLTVLVLQEVDVSYNLPVAMTGKITKVVNKTTGASIFHEVVGSSLLFKKAEISAGDEITVSWE